MSDEQDDIADEKLTPLQERFCQEYLIDQNGKQAAIRAGYAGGQSAEVNASKLLRITKVRHRLEELREKQTERLELSADMVLKALLDIAKADLADAYDDEGGMLSVKQMPKKFRNALAGAEETLTQNGLSRKIKLNDRIKALELLGRHLKLFTDKVEHSGSLTLEELMTKANELE